MLRLVHDLFWNDDGATAVEYAVMLALIIVVCFAVIAAIGTTTKGLFDPDGSISGAMGKSAGGS